MDGYDFTHVIKIILMGDAGVGKTSLIRKYTDNKFDEGYAYTIGIDFRVKEITLSNKERIRLQIWDTAGQECFRSITASYYKRADGIILVYDVTNMKTFQNLEYWLKETQYYHSKSSVPLIIVGNKMDTLNENKQKEKILSLKKFVEEKNNDRNRENNYKINFTFTSVKTDSNIKNIFSLLAEQIHNNNNNKYRNNDGNYKIRNVSLNAKEKENMKFCCFS